MKGGRHMWLTIALLAGCWLILIAWACLITASDDDDRFGRDG